MDLKVTANKYVEMVEKTTGQFKKKFGELVFDEGIDADMLDLVKSMFDMLDVSTQLVREQVITIHEINCKLDKLLDKS